MLGAEAARADPRPEAGAVGRDRGHAERQALLRRVAPWLVERGEARQVERPQHGLVGQVQQAVARPEIARDLDDLDAPLGGVVEAELATALLHRVALGVE